MSEAYIPEWINSGYERQQRKYSELQRIKEFYATDYGKEVTWKEIAEGLAAILGIYGFIVAIAILGQ